MHTCHLSLNVIREYIYRIKHLGLFFFPVQQLRKHYLRRKKETVSYFSGQKFKLRFLDALKITRIVLAYVFKSNVSSDQKKAIIVSLN